MATRTENAINAASVIRYLEAQVSITSPGHNAKLGSSFTVTGVASCGRFKDDGAEHDIYEGDATQNITAVDVRLGGDTNPFERADSTGLPAKPWQNWSFKVDNTTLHGQITITARVMLSAQDIGAV